MVLNAPLLPPKHSILQKSCKRIWIAAENKMATALPHSLDADWTFPTFISLFDGWVWVCVCVFFILFNFAFLFANIFVYIHASKKKCPWIIIIDLYTVWALSSQYTHSTQFNPQRHEVMLCDIGKCCWIANGIYATKPIFVNIYMYILFWSNYQKSQE